MIRVLVVDDEPIALKSTQKLLLTEFPEVQVQTARDGFEAVQRCRERDFGIILMDLAMPGLDGMGTLRRIKEILPEARTVIISAHSQFESAREAVRLGVSAYLLKPYVHREFLELMRQLMGDIQLAAKQETTVHEARETVRRLYERVKREMILHIVSGRQLCDADDCYENTLDWRFRFYRAAVLWVRWENGEQEETRRKELMEALRAEAEQAFNCIAAVFSSRRVMLVLGADEEAGMRTDDMLDRRARFLIDACRKEHSVQMRIGVGQSCAEAEGLHQSYLEAENALKERENAAVSFYCEAQLARAEQTEMPTVETLVSSVLEGDEQRLFQQSEELLCLCFSSELRTRRHAKAVVLETIFGMDRRLREIDPHFFAPDEAAYHQSIGGLATALTEEQLQAAASDYIALVRKHLKGRQMPALQMLVNQAVAFIKVNYRRDITLQEVADSVNVSSFYLSRIFKSVTGQGFAEYLTAWRIGRAKELLRADKLSVRQVAEAVGYANHTYFGKIFREKVGVTPGEYKRQSLLEPEINKDCKREGE